MDCGLWLCSLPFHAVATTKDPVYSIGFVRQLHAIWSPLPGELESRTGYRFRLKDSRTIASFGKDFAAGLIELEGRAGRLTGLKERLPEPEFEFARLKTRLEQLPAGFLSSTRG